MKATCQRGADGQSRFQVLWEDGERVVCRGWCLRDESNRCVLTVRPAAEHPAPASLDCLVYEYGMKDELDAAWAARPLELVRDHGQTILVLDDPGGELLEPLLSAPMEVARFLRLAIGIATTLRKVHQQGLIHKDLKPTGHDCLVALIRGHEHGRDFRCGDAAGGIGLLKHFSQIDEEREPWRVISPAQRARENQRHHRRGR